MKNKLKTVYLLCAILPFAVWLAYFFISGQSSSFYENGLFITAFAVYCAVCVLSFLYGIIKYKCEVGRMSGPSALTVTLINAGALAFMLCVTYSANFDYTPSPCSFLLCAGSVPVLYWAILTASKKEDMTGSRLKKQLCLCVLLPLAVALGLNFNALNTADTVMMSAGAAILTAAVCFVLIYVFSAFKSSGAAQTSDFSEVPYANFYKFCNNTVLIVIFAIALPQICLWLNIAVDNFLGNYTNPAFFIIALLNGILMLPAVKAKFFSLPYLYLQCACFTLIGYFTVVFMPVLPVGLIGIIVMGLGLLTFVPLFIFIMETGQIVYETRKLKAKWKTGALAATVILGIATIPIIFCANAAFDRINLNNALTYLDPYDRSYPAVDTARLLNTIEKSNKVSYRNSFIRDFYEDGTPLTDGVYREIVSGGAYLTEAAGNRLDSIFNPHDLSYMESEPYDPLVDAERGDEDVYLRYADSETIYDEYAGAWKTEVILTLKNKSDKSRREFSCDFYLPDGCIISDFWLDIDGERREGLITDKRAALMTYDSVVKAMQDPGVIFYKDDNTIQLNVFPFDDGEARECGFTVLHSDYETLEIDGKNIPLEPDVNMPEVTEFDGGALIPAPLLSAYPEANRKPYYCFAVDMSAYSRTDELIENLKDFVGAADITEGTIYFASEKVTPVPLSELDNIRIKDDKIYIGDKVITKSGGFNLAGAFGAAQIDTLKIKDEYCPALIAVSWYNMPSAAYPYENDFLPEFPENNGWYKLLSGGWLQEIYTDGREGDFLSVADGKPYKITDGGRKETLNTELDSQICVVTPYGIAAKNGRTQIVYNDAIKPAKNSLYSDALALYARSLENPYDISNVRDSIAMNALCPSTAFSVFETKEQISKLTKTQKQILEGEDIAQPGTVNTLSMDEGGDAVFIAVTAAIILTAAVRRRKTKKREFKK